MIGRYEEEFDLVLEQRIHAIEMWMYNHDLQHELDKKE